MRMLYPSLHKKNLHPNYRPDRDNHVKIHDDDNIAYPDLNQFKKLKYTKTFGFDYDPTSVMHYKTRQGTLYSDDLSKHTITSKVIGI